MALMDVFKTNTVEDTTIEDEKNRLLSDPSKIDKAVADMADYLSPSASSKKPKGEVYGSDTVEASKDSNDPTRGFGTTLRDAYTKALMDPRYKNVPAGKLLQASSESLMATPDNTGRSLRERTNEYTRTENSRWFGGAAKKALPGYDAWHQDKLIQEKQENAKESWLPSAEELAIDTGLGAAFGATAGLAGSGLPGALAGAGVGATAGFALGGPVGAAVGAVGGGIAGVFGGGATGALGGGVLGGVLGAGGSVVAAPLKKLLHKTEWYQGMIQSNSIADKGKAILMDMGAYIPGAVGAQKALTYGTTKALRGSTVGTLTKDIAGMEGKAPAGPGIDLSGERINPEGNWAADGATISRAPGEPAQPFKPAGLLENKQGLLDAMGDSGALPPPPGGGTGTVFAGGPEVPSAPIQAGFTAELPKLIGGTAEIEGKSLIPVGDIEAASIKPISPTLLLEDLRGKDLEDFAKFAAEARGKVYNTTAIPDGSSPVLTEEELFRQWKLMAAKGKRPFNPYEKAVADNTAVVNITQTAQDVAKAKSAIVANPTANNVMTTVKKVKTEVAPVEGSNLVQKHEQLSSKGMQEAGFEPVVDPDIVPLTGTLPEKINAAHERDTFVELGKEESGGKLRTSIAANSEAELKVKSTPAKVEEPIVDVMTKVDPEIVVTPKKQEAAIKNVTEHANGGKVVTEEFFPEVKVTPADDLNLFMSAEDALGQQFAEARTPLKIKGVTGDIEAARAAYLETLGEPGKPATIEELAAGYKELAGGNAKKYANLLKEENVGFLEWATDNGFLSAETAKKNSKYKLIAGMMAFGLPVGVLYDHLSEKEAEAGWLTASIETVAKKAALAKSALDSGLVAETIKPGQTVMGKTNFQRGIILDAKETVAIVNENIRKGTGAGVQYSLMSPYQIMESLFTTGSGKLVNAATHLASFVTAGSRTKDNALRVTKNILDEAGVKVAANQVKEAMTPLVPLAAKATKSDIAAIQLKQAEERLTMLLKKVDANDIDGSAADITMQKESIAKLKETLEGLSGATKAYHDAWNTTAQKLAADHSSVRISLALEDPARKLYPWLPELSRSEEVAVGKLRGLLDQYQVRLKDRGKGTLDNYFPHSPHPEMAKIYNAELQDLLGGVPYQKFYSRTANSRALLPDINYTMNHYLTDIEPRIQNHDFWKKSGWETVKESQLVQSNPGLKRAFDSLYEGSKPVEQTWGNIAAQRYSEFEAVHKLFLSPSAGLKHLVKMTADIVSVGPTVFAKSLPDTVGYMTRKLLNKTYGVNQVSVRSTLEKLGIKSERFSRQLIDDYMDSTIMSGNMRKYMLDMGIESQEQIFSTAKNIWKGVQDVGSTWINLAELADRATSVSSALQMAGKRGMTVDQAMYGTYDLILKNNFLFGQFNPSWLNNPKIRALLMFQATPFKIFERRLVNAQRSYANLGQLTQSVRDIVKQPGGWEKVYADVKSMKAYMREGQSELKANLIIDTLRQETDFFGTPVVRQMITDMLTVGAFTYGGAQAGMALSDHFFHIPFLSTQSEEGKAELALSPLVSGAMKGYSAWKNREDSEDFLFKSVMDRWLGPYGPLPKTLEKAVKLNNNDIPEIYRKGGDSGYLKYLFGVPGHE